MSDAASVHDPPRPGHVFRIYLAGESPNSMRALANLYAICRRYYPSSHRIEIIDVLKDSKAALAESIFVTPTVVKLSPAPEVHIIGNLSDEAEVLRAFGLPQEVQDP
jgi:circadian clock protein KaiB